MSQQGANCQTARIRPENIQHNFTDRGNILPGNNTQYKRRDHEDNFWTKATQDLATVTKETLPIKVFSKRVQVFNKLFKSIID